jgi:hypothetical protein
MSDIADTKDIINLTLTADQIDLIQEGLQLIQDEMDEKAKEILTLRQFIGYKLITRERKENNNG